ncbi:MipA/OmpV family protein [Sinimarinibacterium sp. CAU 1509]|uniref:MipA/OmpV family protein n=1 Tax=Sinimarinibacterium sp. CAU 1509 TaxID=2562283 RepID=UPI0010ABE10D|nr:MipA/OmpV family protein [Sinimarinibacterium sp. CAU 1509]TJY65007.1 MipA/OmpV family protein [Sinimarinibacterium sp. CAU 1509]
MTLSFPLRRSLLLLGLCCTTPLLHAQTAATPVEDTRSGAALPRWEAGIAGAAFTVPDYPAADEYRSLALPAPYFVYRGRVLRADEEGSRLRRRLGANLELDLSGGGALSSDSSGSDARRGMPDLGYLLELGPNLRLTYPGPAHDSAVVVNLPVRGVISVGDGGLNWRGAVLAPELAYRADRYLDSRLGIWLSLATEFGSGALQRYFYEVAPRYATVDRPAYDADAGYLGSSLGLRGAYTLTPRLRLFASVRYYAYSGAANQDSPLFRRDDGYTAAIGLSWTVLQSSKRAVDIDP